MTKMHAIKLFEEKKVRSVWDSDTEEWYFSVKDTVELLTESRDVKQYIKKMRKRDPELNSSWGTIYTPAYLEAEDGKKISHICGYCQRTFSYHSIHSLIQS